MILEIIALLGIFGVVSYNIFTNNKTMSLVSGLILIVYLFMVHDIIPNII